MPADIQRPSVNEAQNAETVTCLIDSQRVEARPHESIIEAALRVGIEIPGLCWHPDLSVAGSCRMCMVEIEGEQWPVSACSTSVVEGMRVETETPALVSHRRSLLQLLVDDTSFAAERNTCAKSGATTTAAAAAHENNAFDRLLDRYGVTATDHAIVEPKFELDSDPNPVINVDLNRCILCTRCVRACDEVQGRSVWGLADKGYETRLIAGADTTMLDARCESCGLCAAVCPTGATPLRILSSSLCHQL